MDCLSRDVSSLLAFTPRGLFDKRKTDRSRTISSELSDENWSNTHRVYTELLGSSRENAIFKLRFEK